MLEYNSPDRAPVAVFAYNRPDRLRAMIDSLKACRGFSDTAVRIFVDGPKRDEDGAAVHEVRTLVQNLALPNISWSFQQENRGLRQSVFTGVSEIIERDGRAIVLEDDLILSPISLDYFNLMLREYEFNDRVWSVAGYIYDAPMLRNSSRALMLPFTHPWGWATWARAWRQFELDSRPTDETLNAQAFARAFDMNGLYPFSAQLKNSIDGRVNSWFIHWYYTIFDHGGASIFPPRRLIDNYGFNEGSHGGALNPHTRLVERPPLLDVLPQGCDDSINYGALDLLKNSRELHVQRMIARAGSAKRLLATLRHAR